MNRSGALSALPRAMLTALLGAVVLTGVGPIADPSPVSASTATSMESSLLTWINAARAKKGLIGLKLHPKLDSLAADRAQSMASKGQMQHASCLSCEFNGRGIQWYRVGEVISYTTYPWGSQAATSIFNGWKGSSFHWSALMSTKFNYIGLGVAYRSSSRTTYAAGVLSESVDQTKPWARMSGGSRSGTTVSWAWTGADTRLQTHTAGFKNFVVQYRVDSGAWSTIRTGTTASSLSLGSRARGHCYSLRVQARDNRGYLSTWTTAVRVCVP